VDRGDLEWTSRDTETTRGGTAEQNVDSLVHDKGELVLDTLLYRPAAGNINSGLALTRLYADR